MIININSKGPVEFFSWEEIANNKSKKSIKLEVKDWGAFMEHAVMMNELRIWAVATYPKIFKDGLSASSWYRDPEYNALPSVGGDENSIHLDARATDIDNIPENLYHDFTIAWQVICLLHGKVGGVNYYEWGMHFDSYEDKFGHKTFQIRDYRKEK
jgi:hypothetical protein